MALSDRRILEEMKKGDIVIEPFHKENLATSSYDVTLGEYYFREQRPKHLYNIYNIYDKRHTDHVWGTTPHKAEKAKEVFQDTKFEYIGIKPDEKIILLEPGETVLAHTQEFIGGRNHITTMMKARSSLGRNFIEVCKCAGWGDVGYTNRWTMEITNNSSHYSIPLVVGRRIAQIIFFETGPILKTDYTKTGKYQSSQNIKEMKRDWNPLSMLPKLYTDRDIKK
ncbi:dCTP deaminase [Candidatus Parcubacteria bacterium]|nr:dCTP deaminase [Candidatus Parcubacteria bacterium]